MDADVTLESVRKNWTKVTEMENGDFPSSNQEATMDMVGKLSPLTEGKSLPDDATPKSMV